MNRNWTVSCKSGSNQKSPDRVRGIQNWIATRNGQLTVNTVLEWTTVNTVLEWTTVNTVLEWTTVNTVLQIRSQQHWTVTKDTIVKLDDVRCVNQHHWVTHVTRQKKALDGTSMRSGKRKTDWWTVTSHGNGTLHGHYQVKVTTLYHV